MAAVDFQGKVAWQKPIVELRGKDVGKQPADSLKYVNLCIATSPILYKDLVIQICDNGGGGPEHLPEGETRDDYKNKPSSIMAFDCKTGELKYREDRTGDSISWSTPILVTFNDRAILVHKNSRAAQGIDPDNGKVLWSFRAQQNVRTSFVYGAGLVYSAGEGRSSMAFTVDAASTGDISKNVKWTFPFETGLGGYCSPVIVDGTMYRYVAGGGKRASRSDEASPLIGKLCCVEMATGKQVHVLDMPGFTNWASPVATADGYIYFATGTKSYVIKAGPKPEIVGINELGDYNPAPSPAVADGKLIVRGSSKLWCIGKP
jgi:outer membrane protein assembly factor BamB